MGLFVAMSLPVTSSFKNIASSPFWTQLYEFTSNNKGPLLDRIISTPATNNGQFPYVLPVTSSIPSSPEFTSNNKGPLLDRIISTPATNKPNVLTAFYHLFIRRNFYGSGCCTFMHVGSKFTRLSNTFHTGNNLSIHNKTAQIRSRGFFNKLLY